MGHHVSTAAPVDMGMRMTDSVEFYFIGVVVVGVHMRVVGEGVT